LISFVYTNRMAGKEALPPPPRAPISRSCITRKEYKSTLLSRDTSLRRRTSPLGSPDPRRRETAWVPTPGTVADRLAPGPAGGFPGPGQAPTLGQALKALGGSVRPCEAAWSPLPPFRGRSDRLHLREAAEAALGGRRTGDLSSGLYPPRPRRDRAAWRRSACLRTRRCPRRPRRRLRPRTHPGTGVLLRRGETEGGSSLVGRRPPRTGPAGKPPGTAPGRGGRPGACQPCDLYVQPPAFCEHRFLPA
jgi:hypothetical protein